MGGFLLQITYLCTIGCSVYTSGWLLLKAGRNKETLALAACQALVIIWCVPLLFSEFLTARTMKYVAYGISYAGISFIGPAWLEFSFRYCKKDPGPFIRRLLFGISIFNYAMFLTNENHNLFYWQFEVETVKYGPVFYFHMLFTYVCVVGGMAVVFREFIKRRVEVKHLAVICLAGAIPLCFNGLYLSGVVKSGFDLTPPAFAWSSFLMLIAVFRYDFLDVNAMAFEHIFDSIAEGVLVYDRRGRLTYHNQAAERWIGLGENEDMESVNKKLRAMGFSGLLPDGGEREKQEEREDPKKREFRKERKLGEEPGAPKAAEALQGDGTRLRMKQYQYKNSRGQTEATAVIVTDVSEFYLALKNKEELEFSERRLAVEQERNRIAQEVHDTTGHTLTMIQSLLRLMRTQMKELTPQAGVGPSPNDTIYEYMAQAQELVTGGIRELRCSINEMRREKEITVTGTVKDLAGRVKEIPVEVEIQGEDCQAYTCLAPVVYGILREAITNCLKYAEASRMDVIVKFERDFLKLFIFDDGRGCENIRENNGIRGIRERTEKAGGTVRFFSTEGEGFQIYLSLPVKEQKT